jgi:hypothetical protein
MIDHFLFSDYGKRPPLCEVEPDRQLVSASVQRTPVLALVLNARSARTRAAGYDGPLVMGLDRMSFEIKDGVKVLVPQPLDELYQRS